MPDLSPEKRARQQIDAQLTACGWVVQDYKAVEFSAGRGIALREVPLTTGPCDYLLLVDRKARRRDRSQERRDHTLDRRGPIRPLRKQPPCISQRRKR